MQQGFIGRCNGRSGLKNVAVTGAILKTGKANISLTITESISFCSFVIATAPYSIQGSSIGDLAGKSVDSLPKDGTAKRVLNLPKAVSAPITASCDCHWPIKVAKPDGGCDLLPFLCPAAFSFFYLSR